MINNSPRSHNALSRSRPQRLGALLCCVLGFIYACGPIFHGLFHVNSLPHRHVAESVHHHAHGHHSHGTAHHGSDDHEQPSNERWTRKDADTQPRPATPADGQDDGGYPFFFVLEIDATDSVSTDLVIAQVVPVQHDAHPDWDSVTYEPELGSVGPRGPPA